MFRNGNHYEKLTDKRRPIYNPQRQQQKKKRDVTVSIRGYSNPFDTMPVTNDLAPLVDEENDLPPDLELKSHKIMITRSGGRQYDRKWILCRALQLFVLALLVSAAAISLYILLASPSTSLARGGSHESSSHSDESRQDDDRPRKTNLMPKLSKHVIAHRLHDDDDVDKDSKAFIKEHATYHDVQYWDDDDADDSVEWNDYVDWLETLDDESSEGGGSDEAGDFDSNLHWKDYVDDYYNDDDLPQPADKHFDWWSRFDDDDYDDSFEEYDYDSDYDDDDDDYYDYMAYDDDDSYYDDDSAYDKEYKNVDLGADYYTFER